MKARNVSIVLAVMVALALPIRAAACTSAAECDDGNLCTDDLCDPEGDCIYAKVSNACDDGNACSINDTCNAGTCVGGSAASGCTSCQAIAILPPEGGTFVGVTAGTGSLTSSCGTTGPSPERVYRWTPISSGPAIIQTCGNGTLYDSVLHVRAGTCPGTEIACNDDTAGCTTGEPNDHHGSQLSFNATAGQTYVIVVDGYNGARGTYTLSVTPPSFCGNGVRESSEICDGADASACQTGQCTSTCTCVPPATGLPDLVPQITDVSVALNTTVANGDVVEGCAEATSGVDLLRFGAYSRNDGTADFVLGDPVCPTPCDQHPLEVCGNPDFICSPAQGHNHAHYNNYARYDLLDQNGQSIVVGHKQGYCLRDTNCATPFYTCVNQGITAGCSDLYGSFLGCQYLDITGVPSGTYVLRVTIDPFARIAELSETNNVVQQSVMIVRPTPTSTAVTPTRTATPSRTPTPTVVPSAGTPTPSRTPTPSATATPSGPTTTPTPTLSATPAATATASPAGSPTASPTATSTVTSTVGLTGIPTTTPSPIPCPIAGIIPPTGDTVTGVTSGIGNRSGTCAATALSPEAIYQFTPTTSGTATFSTCGTATRYDTVVYVRSDTCTGSQLACNDDTVGCETGEPNDHHGSRLAVNVTAGRTYFVFVDGFNGAAGAYALTTVLVAATPTRTASPTPSASPTPVPNACTLAIAISSEGGTFTGTTAGSNTLTASCASTNVSPEQVYQWTPTRSGTALIETCGTPTLFDTVVSVRQTTCIGGAERACNDDTTGCTTGEPNDHHGSRLSVQVTAEQTYYVVVDGYGGTRGAYQLRIVPPPQ